MKAYKVFNSDWTCRGFQYKVGKTYTLKGKIEICTNGFHACIKPSDCFKYYSFDYKNKCAEVELLGKIEKNNDKLCTSKIKIVREIKWIEMFELCNNGLNNTGLNNSGDMNSGNKNSGNMNSGDMNSGDRNSGDWNSGNWNSGDMNSGNKNSGNMNSGDMNSGDRNSGDWNSGNWNSGNWNSGDRNSGNRNSGNWNKCNKSSGYFNTKNDYIIMFNKECKKQNINFPNCLYFDLIKFIPTRDMTEEEKQQHPEYKTMHGYLKKLEYKEAFKEAMEKATKEEIEQIKALPNFDADIFYEISGYRIK